MSKKKKISQKLRFLKGYLFVLVSINTNGHSHFAHEINEDVFIHL